MKKLIILLLFPLFFVSCKKQEIEPKEQLLSIEVFTFCKELKTIDFSFHITGQNIDFEQEKTIIIKGSSIVFKYEFMAKIDELVNLEITTSEPVWLNLQAYSDVNKKSFVIASNSNYGIKPLQNNVVFIY